MPSLLDQRPARAAAAITVAPLCAAAAYAPVDPSPVLSHGIWPAAVTLLLCLHRWRPALPDILAVTVAAWASATALGSPQPDASSRTVGYYWACALLFVAARAAAVTRRRLVALAVAYLAGCGWAAWRILSQDKEVDPFTGEPVRVGLDGVNVNYTAYALVTGVLVAVLLWKTTAARRVRVPLAAAVAVFSLAVVQTGTRGAQVALVCAAGYLLAGRWARRVWRPVMAAAPVLLVVVPLGVYGDGHLLWWQQWFPRASDDLSGRLVIWPYARAAWADHVWTGVGPGVFRGSNPLGIGPHSLLLTLGTDLGLLGAVVFGAVVAVALVAACRVGDDGRRLAGLLLVCWAPIWLTGHWELSPAAWLVLALWSRLPTVWPGLDGRPDDVDLRAGGVVPAREVAGFPGGRRGPRRGQPVGAVNWM